MIRRLSFSAIVLIFLLPIRICTATPSSQSAKVQLNQAIEDSISQAWQTLPNTVHWKDIPFGKEITTCSPNDLSHLIDYLFKFSTEEFPAPKKANAYCALANLAAMSGLTNQSLTIADKIIELSREHSLKAPLARAYFVKGVVLYEHYPKKDGQAFLYLLRARDSYRTLSDERQYFLLEKSIADFHFRRGNPDLAIEFYQDIIENGEAYFSERNIIDAWNAIGLIYQKRKDYETALNYFHEAHQLSQEVQDSVWIGLIEGNIGELYLEKGSYGKAIPLLLSDLTLTKQYNERSNLIKAYRLVGDAYFQLNKYDSAQRYYLSALPFLDSLGISKKQKTALYASLSAYYAKQQQYEQALFYSNLRAEEELESVEAFSTLEARKETVKETLAYYEKEKRGGSLIEKNSEQTITIQRQKVWNFTVVVTSLITILLSVIFYQLAVKRNKMNKKLQRQYKIISQQKEEIDTFYQLHLIKTGEIEKFNNKLTRAIEKQTKDLAERNRILEEYAFMNAHKVRGPLARILGIFYLWKNDYLSKEESQELLNRAEVEAKKLDEIINSINEKLGSSGDMSS